MADGPTRWEIEGRADKAWKLAHFLKREGYTHETVATWTQAQWDYLARRAKVASPSEKTQGLVVGYLTQKPG